MKFTANAKINVYLKVLGENKNGFHDLDSLMVPIDLCDYIEMLESDKDEIEGMDIPLESNLIYKAIEKIRCKYNIKKKIKVIIEKNIPSFAGLGGGSSDAAAIIKALNEMWNLKMTTGEMEEVGAELGSDVPFFIKNKPAIIKGRGEKITEVMLPVMQGILIFDGLKFSTKEVFANMKEYSKEYENIVDGDGNKIKDYFSLVTNDLEKGIWIYEDAYRIEKQKKELLELGAKAASMSGSGSSVFGLFDVHESEIVKKSFEQIKNKYQSVWIFKMINGKKC